MKKEREFALCPTKLELKRLREAHERLFGVMADPRSAGGRGSSLSPLSNVGNELSSVSGAAPSQVLASTSYEPYMPPHHIRPESDAKQAVAVAARFDTSTPVSAVVRDGTSRSTRYSVQSTFRHQGRLYASPFEVPSTLSMHQRKTSRGRIRIERTSTS